MNMSVSSFTISVWSKELHSLSMDSVKSHFLQCVLKLHFGGIPRCFQPSSLVCSSGTAWHFLHQNTLDLFILSEFAQLLSLIKVWKFYFTALSIQYLQARFVTLKLIVSSKPFCLFTALVFNYTVIWSICSESASCWGTLMLLGFPAVTVRSYSYPLTVEASGVLSSKYSIQFLPFLVVKQTENTPHRMVLFHSTKLKQYWEHIPWCDLQIESANIKY